MMMSENSKVSNEMTNNKPQKDQTEGISISQLILNFVALCRFLGTKWKFLLALALIGGISGFFYAYMSKPLYIAELTFVVESGSTKSSVSSYAGLAAQFGINLGGGSGGDVFQEENILPLLLSRFIIKKTLLEHFQNKGKDSILANKYIGMYQLHKLIEKLGTVQKIEYDQKSELSLAQELGLEIMFKKIINENIIADKDKKSGIFTLKVQSNDEEFSIDFCRNLLTNISAFYIDTKTGKIKRNMSILQNKTDSVYRMLHKSLVGQASSIDQNLNVVRQLGMVSSKTKEINLSIEQAEYSELKKNLETVKFDLLNETPLFQIIDKPVLPLDKIKVSKAKAIIIGSLLTMLSGIIYFVSKKVWKQALSDQQNN